MPAVCLAEVVGTGTDLDPYRASISVSYSALMIHPATMRCIVATTTTPANNEPGVTILFETTTWDALRTYAVNNSPTDAELASINDWLVANGYTAVGPGTWEQVIEAAAAQVNPVADLMETYTL